MALGKSGADEQWHAQADQKHEEERHARGGPPLRLIAAGRQEKGEQREPIPVSYTQLDVYKRQAQA